MLKKNLNKKLFALVLSINERIERYFNFFKKTSATKSSRFSDSVEKNLYWRCDIIFYCNKLFFNTVIL